MAPAGLVFLDRSRLRAAQLSGHLDASTAGWAEGVMDSTGIPDGLPVITCGETVFEPAWRWQRSAPQAQAAATRTRYMLTFAAWWHFWRPGGFCSRGPRARTCELSRQERRSATSAATWAVEETALMSFFRFCSGEGQDGWRVFDRNPWPLWRTARSDRSALRRPADTLPATPRFLDDDELRHFLLAGIQGRDPTSGELLADDWPVGTPLVPERDLAFATFVLATGARMTEARLVLIDEILTDVAWHPWPSVWMQSVGKTGQDPRWGGSLRPAGGS